MPGDNDKLDSIVAEARRRREERERGYRERALKMYPWVCGRCGREFDRTFVDSLPETADPCGENGEFHTFVYNAPVFSEPVPYRVVDTRDEGQFSYAVIEAAS